MKDKYDTAGLKSLIKPVVWGCIFGTIITFLIMMLLAFFLTVKDFPKSFAAPLVSVAAGIGSLAAGFVAAKKFKKQGFQIGALTGFVLFLIVVLVSMFVSGAGFSILSVIRLLIMVLSSSIGGLFSVNMKQKRKIV